MLSRLIHVIHAAVETIREWAPQVVSILRDQSRPWSVKRSEIWKVLRPVFLPDWLSRRVRPIRVIRQRTLAGDSPNVAERFHRLLHRFHSFRASLFLALGVTVGAVLVSILGGMVLTQHWHGDPPSSVGAALLTISEVLGGVAGLLFAALVFGVQFHGERLGQSSFLVRYLARREGIVPVAGFTLAVIAANLFVGLLTTKFMAPAALTLAALDTVLVPAVLILTIWLIHRLVAVISGDFFEQSLKPGLTWEYQRGLDEELHRTLLLQAYEEVLRDVGIEHKLSAGFWIEQDSSSLTLPLSRKGEIRDVNVDELHTLGRLIGQSHPYYEAIITVAPYDRVGDGPALVLVARHDSNHKPLSVQNVDRDTIARIDGILQRVFLLGVVREREIVELLTRFQKTVIGYARYDRPDQLKRALDVYEHLIEQRLLRGVRETGPVSFSYHRLPDFLGDFEYGELAEGTVNSADREKIEIVLIFAVRIMNLAIEQQHTVLLHKAGDLVAAIYWHGHARDAIQPWLGDRIDMWINHVLERFRVRHFPLGRDWDEDQANAELPLLKVALAWVLGLIKIAMEADRQQDAEDFQSRIFMFDRFFHQRQLRLPGERPPKAISVALDLHVYAMIILTGWCLYLARSCGRRTDTVKNVFRRCVADCCSRHDLILAWERIRHCNNGDSSIDSQLGVEHWHESDRRWRTGVPQQSLFARSWVPDGFVALGLVRPAAGKYEVPYEFQEPPAVGYDVASIECKAKALIQDDYVRAELLQLDENAAQQEQDQFLNAIRERVCMAKRATLARIVNAPLSVAKRDKVHSDVRQHVSHRRSMLGVIEKLGGLSQRAIVSLMPARISTLVSKSNFVEGEHGSYNLGEVLAQSIAEAESVRLAYTMECCADEVLSFSGLDELAPAVLAAIKELRNRGFTPTLIIVPLLPHALQKLCGARWPSSLSRIEGNCGAKFEGIPIVEYPYIDAESVTVVDVGSFFGKAGFSPLAELTCLTVKDRHSTENQLLVNAAPQEVDPSRITDEHDLRVQVVLRMLAGAGLRDTHAAVRIRLDPQALGYAFRDTDKYYHRPDCGVVANATDVEFSLHSRVAANFGQRSPCPDCKPDEWAKAT